MLINLNEKNINLIMLVYSHFCMILSQTVIINHTQIHIIVNYILYIIYIRPYAIHIYIYIYIYKYNKHMNYY